MLRLKADHGALEIKGLGIRLTPMSTSEEIESALKVAPQLEQFIDRIEEKKVTPPKAKENDKAKG